MTHSIPDGPEEHLLQFGPPLSYARLYSLSGARFGIQFVRLFRTSADSETEAFEITVKQEEGAEVDTVVRFYPKSQEDFYRSLRQMGRRIEKYLNQEGGPDHGQVRGDGAESAGEGVASGG